MRGLILKPSVATWMSRLGELFQLRRPAALCTLSSMCSTPGVPIERPDGGIRLGHGLIWKFRKLLI